jgi:hypothetical protein
MVILGLEVRLLFTPLAAVTQLPLLADLAALLLAALHPALLM